MRALLLFAVVFVAWPAVACSGVDPPAPPSGAPVTADVAAAIAGIPDRGWDPAVVALSAGGGAPCTGALVAPDVVVTARHCVWEAAGPVQCPATGPQALRPVPPQSIRVFTGDDAATAVERARGVAVSAPPGDAFCQADVALVRIDVPIVDVAPLVLRGTATAIGGHVRTVGFGRLGGGGALKVVREHVPVTGASEQELVVAEAACEGDSGGVALDETTGELVAVGSRHGPTCDDAAAFEVLTRLDAFFPLIDEVLAPPDAGVPRVILGASSHAAKWKRGPLDAGSACARGVDCAAGACVDEGARRFCSRTCSAHDKCPTRYRCERAQQDAFVCVAK